MATCGIKLLLVLVTISVCSVYSNPNIYGVGLPLSYVYYTKSDWGGVQSTDVRPLKTPVPYVVIHHTYIPGACSTPEECKADMRSMQNYHISMGWGDIGYNFCIGSDGGVYEGRGWDNIGIHAGPANNYSIGICLIGDWRGIMAIYLELLVFAYIVDVASSGAVFRTQDADDDNEVSSYDFPFVTRSMWHARPPKEKNPLQTPVPYVVIHHSYSPPACYDAVTCRQAMRSMQNFHMDSRGWWDIGYNFAVGSDGAAYEGRGWTVLGAHALHFNNVSIGICLIGDWSYLVPPSNQLKSAKALINVGVELGFIKSDYKLIGHRQVRETECPGDALFHEIQTWDHWSSFPASYKDLDKIDLTGSQNKS